MIVNSTVIEVKTHGLLVFTRNIDFQVIASKILIHIVKNKEKEKIKLCMLYYVTYSSIEAIL